MVILQFIRVKIRSNLGASTKLYWCQYQDEFGTDTKLYWCLSQDRMAGTRMDKGFGGLLD